MAHFIKKIGIKLLVIFVAFLLFFISQLSQNKDWYRVNNIDIDVLSIAENNTKQYVILKLILHKAFISNKYSKWQLLSSIEPGVNGLLDTQFHFTVFSKLKNVKIDIGKLFFASNITSNKFLSGKESEFYNQKTSLDQFINDIKVNKEYTRGVSFDNCAIYFIFKPNPLLSDEKSIIINSDLNLEKKSKVKVFNLN